jgi:hypothetical protein
MHEGKRPDDYIEMAISIRKGVLVLATHTWHMMETYGSGVLSEDAIGSNLQDIKDVLEGIRAQGMEFITLEELANSMEE